MTFETNWDVEYYRTDYESEEHWNLRKKFMEVHKDKFPEDELVCLAQVFTNVEFMGCKYPDKTMIMVGELSQEVAAEFRKERASRLKRTFVKASDAAEARAKVRRTQQYSNDFKNVSSETIGGFENNQTIIQKTQQLKDAKSMKKKLDPFKLFKRLKYDQLVLYITPATVNNLKMWGAKSKRTICERITKNKLNTQYEWLVDEKVIATATKPVIKEAKAAATKIAKQELLNECYSIRENTNYEKIDISKMEMVLGSNNLSTGVVLNSSNVGFRMMKKLGWGGGALGNTNDGIEEPIDLTGEYRGKRQGFGYINSSINLEYLKAYLQSYIQSEDIRDIHFDPNFDKDEREQMHSVINQMSGLINNSVNDGENRYLTIKKKLEPIQILEHVLIHKSPEYIKKFLVKVPEKKASKFPDFVDVKIVD